MMSDPVGAGSSPYNCKECSSDVADSLRTFSLTQNPADLSSRDCGCEELWKKVLEIELHLWHAHFKAELLKKQLT